MLRSMTLTAALIMLAGAANAQTHCTSMPMGGGWASQNCFGPNGQSYTGTTMPMGGGWSSTTYTGNNGHMMTCTTMPTGGGWKSTDCR